MAASMRGSSKLKFSRSILRLCKRHKTQPHPHETKYFVALPTIPSDTPETNSLLRYEELPQFDLPAKKVLTGVAKRILEYEVEVEKVVENIENKDKNTPVTLEEVFDPIERARVPMWYAHSVGSHMIHSKSDYKLGLVCDRNDRQISAKEGDRWRIRPLFETAKTFQKQSKEMKPYHQRMVDFYVHQGKVHGLDIKKVNKYNDLISWAKKEEYFCKQFNDNVDFAFRSYMTKIESRSELGPIPDFYLSLMVPPGGNINKGPYNLNLTASTYNAMMEYCSNRRLRKEIWMNYNGQAGEAFAEFNTSNGLTINDIRSARGAMARLAGYPDYADMKLCRRMVGSVENLSSFLNGMRTAVLDNAKNDVELIRQFAASHGFRKKLEVWDYDFFKNEKKKREYWYDENQVAQYFPYPKVRDNMFQISKDLFGLSFEEITDCDKVDPSVEVYKVIEEDGSEAGVIYLDPYRRPYKFGGFYTEVCRDHSSILGTKPIVFLTLNLAQPASEGEPSLMTFAEMYTMFGEFGCTLQHVLAKSPYSELAGSNNLEEDAANISYHVLKEFALEPAFIRKISSHHSTGEPIPKELMQTVLKASKHMMAYEVSKEIYYAALDLEMYITSGMWYPIFERIYKLYLPIPLHEDDWHPCHMRDLFTGEKAISYYCNLWTQMIATDIFKAFEETGYDDNQKLAAVGRRFRDTFLYHGGDEDPSETFRKFRGRDPSPLPFQDLFRLKQE